MDKTQIILQLSRYEDSLKEIRYAKFVDFFNELYKQKPQWVVYSYDQV